jgi:glucose-6-phosphate dehydrogenase assembly protein OpcA
MAGWIALTLRCPVTRTRTPAGTGLISVVLDRESGPVQLVRPEGNVATLTQPGQPERRVSLPPRSDRDCLAEELRRLDPDEIYAEVLSEGLKLFHDKGTTKTGRSGGSGRTAKRTVTASPSPVANDEPGPPQSPSAPPAGS